MTEIGSDATSQNDIQGYNSHSRATKVPQRSSGIESDSFIFCCRAWISAGRRLMSDGFPPREQHSERPELAVTRASVCVQKIGVSPVCADKVSIRVILSKVRPEPTAAHTKGY